MEQKAPAVAKKVWNLVREVYFMLRKCIIKRKLLQDFNMMIMRGKNLMFHHHNNNETTFTTNHRSHHLPFLSPPPGEYEFSCSNSPGSSHHPFSLFSRHKKYHSNNKPSEDHLDMMAINAVLKAMQTIHSQNSSPALPGFGSTPTVRQLRVTDSPFPLSSMGEDNQVNEEAEQFISRFYNDLQLQNTKASFGPS
ncbi:hypothetical protein L2E82_16636 [Cichorium intybus]|uniref:Uncharacterized protein n=1 Tax=Cichorium intybus TaxID=13427 RepID=A0ACB9F7E6_CICIN|nr:hypothetical protein L2E82_16636 [Cichorium intybus]